MEGKKIIWQSSPPRCFKLFRFISATLNMSSGRISHFPHQQTCPHHHSDGLSPCSWLGSLIAPQGSISAIILSPLFNKPSLLLQASYRHLSLYHCQALLSPLSLANLPFPLGLLPAWLIIRLPFTSFPSGVPPWLLRVSSCLWPSAPVLPPVTTALYSSPSPRTVATYSETSFSVCNHLCTS